MYDSATNLLSFSTNWATEQGKSKIILAQSPKHIDFYRKSWCPGTEQTIYQRRYWCQEFGDTVFHRKCDKSFDPNGFCKPFQWKTVSQQTAPPLGTQFFHRNMYQKLSKASGDLPGKCQEGLQRCILQHLVHSKPSRHLSGRSPAFYFAVLGALQGRRETFPAFAGKVCRVVFYSTWCTPRSANTWFANDKVSPTTPITQKLFAKFFCTGWTPDWREEIWKC